MERDFFLSDRETLATDLAHVGRKVWKNSVADVGKS